MCSSPLRTQLKFQLSEYKYIILVWLYCIVWLKKYQNKPYEYVNGVETELGTELKIIPVIV